MLHCAQSKYAQLIYNHWRWYISHLFILLLFFLFKCMFVQSTKKVSWIRRSKFEIDFVQLVGKALTISFYEKKFKLTSNGFFSQFFFCINYYLGPLERKILPFTAKRAFLWFLGHNSLNMHPNIYSLECSWKTLQLMEEKFPHPEYRFTLLVSLVAQLSELSYSL